MRIAQVANFYGPRSGGLRTSMHALGRGYVACGDRVLLVVPGDDDRVEDTPRGRVITLHSPLVPMSGGYRIITRTGAVHDALDEFAPDAIEVSDRTTLASLGPWARRRGIPTTFVAHERVDGLLGTVLPGPLRTAAPRIAARHSRWIASRFDNLVATTAFAGDELARVGAPVETIPLGVDLVRFHPSRASGMVRSALAPDHEPLLLLASRLSPEKRPDLAIEAVRELGRRGRRVRMVVAGSGPLDREMRRRATGLPIEFLGFVTDRETFASLLATADALVAPGPIETFGLAALEGLASGTPAVVNSASALPEVVGSAGAVAPSHAAAFADAIEDVLGRDARERRRAARARAEDFPWETTVARMRALHASTLAGAR